MKKTLFMLFMLGNLHSFAQTTWALDKSHTTIGFSAVHMLISDVQGKFDEFNGEVISNTDDFADSKVSFTATVASINTGNERRDNHLKSEDFFNAEKNPTIGFSGIITKEADKYFLAGDFTMAGTTKTVKFDVKYNGQIPGTRGRKAGFKVTGTVNRFDYGLKWDRTIEAGGLVVSENIDITCNIELNEKTGDN